MLCAAAFSALVNLLYLVPTLYMLQVYDRYVPSANGGTLLLVSAMAAAGLLTLALLPAAPSVPDLVWRLALTGLGFGIFQAPNNKVLISSAPRERSGGASGIQSTARLVGQSTGVAVLAVVFGLVPAHPVPVALGLACALAAAGILPSALRRFEPEPKQDAAEQIAA